MVYHKEEKKMTYQTLYKRIRYWDNEVLQAKVGNQGYYESINVLQATEKLCHYTVLMLKKSEKDGIPFQEFEFKMKDNMEKLNKKA